jgi:hypothetical protein
MVMSPDAPAKGSKRRAFIDQHLAWDTKYKLAIRLGFSWMPRSCYSLIGELIKRDPLETWLILDQAIMLNNFLRLTPLSIILREDFRMHLNAEVVILNPSR